MTFDLDIWLGGALTLTTLCLKQRPTFDLL